MVIGGTDMAHNRTFWKALHSLVHPLSLMAILLLLFNDHWLRYAHPSWLTGKLGDFTWLVFAPFITALLLAWIVPQRWKQHSRIVRWLSIGFIGVWFATAKTIPFVHDLTTQTLYAIVGWQGQLRLDITDLLTLPALLISWHIWRTASDEKVSLKPLAYVAFGLGVLGTLASDMQHHGPGKGVFQICDVDGLPLVETHSSHTKQYRSPNGGLFWEAVDRSNTTIQSSTCGEPLPESQFIITDSFLIRWIPNETIEISKDDGNTWVVEYDLSILRQDIRQQYIKMDMAAASRVYITDGENFNDPSVIISKYYKTSNIPSPVEAYYDADSGNIIFAMSWNGVLVRTNDGEYTWVSVGKYGLEDLANISKASGAIFFELWLALATIFLTVTTSKMFIRRRYRSTITILMVMSWAGYGGILLLLFVDRSGDTNMSVVSPTGLASLIMLVFFGIPLSIGAVWDILYNFRSVALQIMLAGLGNGALFIFPFLLWTQARIPNYVTAFAFSVFLTLLGLFATRIYLKRVLPILEPEKMKRDAIEKDKKSKPS
jgi:hypothetical protein